MEQLPVFGDIEAAAARLSEEAVVTPLIESADLNRRLGGRILLKAENLQRTGSFKFRGAYNRLGLIPDGERAAGVVAYSSGNHAQGVAAAAQIYGMPATIVMPEDAPSIKVENTKGFGAKVVFYDRYGEDRKEIAERIARETGATLIRPYDDLGIIAGQGTSALEAHAQAKALGAHLDAYLVCCGGGGFSAGCALALSELSPETEVFTVEPEGFDDTARSFETGEIQQNLPDAKSFCDALLAPYPGQMTFQINQRLAAGGLVVTDQEVAEAMRYAFRTLKLVVEPGGAAALAALLSGKLPTKDRTVAATLSGGNVDPDLYRKVLSEG